VKREHNFVQLLRESAVSNGSITCMGIDPVLEALPRPELSPRRRVLLFFEQILETMARRRVYPAAFKPNIGFFHSLDRPLESRFDGTLALRDLLLMLRQIFPRTPVILDSKRGDIARSSLNYAEEAFSSWDADALTVSPYMGGDSVGPFNTLAAQRGRGVYILNRTSNPGARELQNLTLADGRPLYTHIARKIVEWSEESGSDSIGAVVGATSLAELEELARFYASHGTPLLIPGVGGQGGSASETISVLKKADYPLELARINSSSGLTHPWLKQASPVPVDWPEKVTDRLEKLNGELKI